MYGPCIDAEIRALLLPACRRLPEPSSGGQQAAEEQPGCRHPGLGSRAAGERIRAGPVFEAVSGAIQRQSVALISRAFAGEQQELQGFKAGSDAAAPSLEAGKRCGVSTGELCWSEEVE